MIITKYRCIVFDTNLKNELKALDLKFGPNDVVFSKVFSFNKSYNMWKTALDNKLEKLKKGYIAKKEYLPEFLVGFEVPPNMNP